MSFKEDYRNEMNHIKHNKKLDEQILNQMSEANDNALKETTGKIVKFHSWKAVAAVIALVVVVAAGMNFDKLETYAESLYGAFRFNAGGDAVLLDDIVPLDFDYEEIQYVAYKTYVFGNGHEATISDVYGGAYENADSFYESVGIKLPGTKMLDYQTIIFTLNESKAVGHLSVEFLLEEEKYHINGFCVTDLYDGSGKIGYGEDDNAYYVYEYAEGKQAYFVRDSILDTEHNQRVYFSEGGFIFQLFVENSEEGTETAKEIIKCMVE